MDDSAKVFSGKVVVVTGASAGIGRAVALEFAARGARVAVAGRDPEAVRAVADSCGADAFPVVADLATEEGVRLLAERTLQHFGRLDVLVNNAGVGARATLESADLETFDRVFALNVRAVYQLSHLLAPALVQARGCIVNVSSVAGSTVYTGALPYSMAKAALDHFTNLIALELAPKGVRVNAVSPGVTESSFVRRLTGYTEEEYAAYLRSSEPMIPMGRVCSPEDVAATVVFLAGPGAGCVTGTNVFVDGGIRFVAGNFGQVLEKQIKNVKEE